MAVLANTATATPATGAETDVVSISPGVPLDNITVYVRGGKGRRLEYALYTTVGGVRTRVAQAGIVGSNVASIIAWQTIGKGDGQTEQVDAGGTDYTLTVLDVTGTPGPSPTVTATLAGVDEFDTVPDMNFAQLFALGVGATGTLPTFHGFAQLMDVAIDQTNLPPVIVTVDADCGPGSVRATVKSVEMSGRDEDIASVFRGLQLPVAVNYFVSVTNEAGKPISTTLAAITYSVSITAGGVVVLNGDVIGPSNANTVIKWDNVPLLLAGLGNMGAPPDAGVPIFDFALDAWRSFALSGGATMDNAGVVTLNPAALTLTGNVNGPASANQWLSFMLPANNANVVVPTTEGWYYVAVSGLTAPHSVTLPAAPVAGQVVVVTDEDGSLLTQTFNVVGNGKLVEGVATFAMNAAYPGAFGSICLQYDGTAWHIFADYSQNATSAVVLAGNVNGPSGANKWLSFMLPANNADVVVPTIEGWYYVAVSGLLAPHSVTLPLAPVAGEVVVVTDEDGSLATQPFSVVGNGKLVEGVATFVMNAAYPGAEGSICLQYDGTAWFIFADYDQNATSAVTLTGNVNGPSGANKWLSFMLPANNADVVVPTTEGWYYVAVTGLTPLAARSVTLPAAPVAGEVVVVTDEDGSLAGQTFNVIGNGKLVEGVATFAMNAAYPGSKGSICLQYDGTAWFIFADYDQNATSAITLAGNANGPSGTNRFLSLTLLGNDADVPVVDTEGWYWVRMVNLSVDRTVTLPAAPVNGMVVVVKDGDGSLAVHNIIIAGNGNTIDGAASYTMTAIQNGIKGAVSLQFDAAAPNPGWFLF